MFDETKDVWIKAYKVITVILFFFLIAGGIVGFIISAVGGSALVGIAFLIGGIAGAFIMLASNMLIINLLRNVQIIRSTLVKSTLWRCECGAVNDGTFCTKCGKPKP